jgi:SAM-dependent methyltransferase
MGPVRDLRRTVARLILNLGRHASGAEPPGVGTSSRRLGPFPVDLNQRGDSRRLVPVSRTFGFDRGTPVDRYYIERFLAENARDIRGRVLEVGDNTYTSRFGEDRVERSDVLHVDATNPRATFVGDLARPDVLPEAVFDCIILTQTLQFIFDMRGAMATLYRSLTHGGILLLTAPGISPVDSGEWGAIWYWSITAVGARRLLEEQFQSTAIKVETHGNVLAATAFLYGLALEELDLADLNVFDPCFPVTVAARAVKLSDARKLDVC